MNTCPHCGGDRKPYNVTCTRSHCQEAEYYACMARGARAGTKQRQRLDAQAAAASLRASHHPGWGFRGVVVQR
jgi:hypothetical protein